MKRLFSLVMAVVLAVTLGVTAFAETQATPADRTITITNAASDTTYRLFKIFDAQYDKVNDAITYTIDAYNPFRDSLFDNNNNPVSENKYFKINEGNSTVESTGVINVSEISTFLETVINDVYGDEIYDTDNKYNNFSDEYVIKPTTVAGNTVKFENLKYGYYVIKNDYSTTVITITSNAPYAEVIDKSISPDSHSNFTKKIWDEDLDGGAGWSTSNTATIGDVVQYQVSFTGLNYDKREQIQYYTIHDQKGDALWVEFGNNDPNKEKDYNIKITVGEQELKRGYYLPVGNIADFDESKWEWKYLGDWSGVEQDRDNAQWYLEHIGYDRFNIIIPWLSGHEVVGEQRQGTNYGLKFDEDAAQLYPGTPQVTIEYYASVEPNAIVGTGENLFNEAKLYWTCAKDGGSFPKNEWIRVNTNVYGLAIKKTDADTLNKMALPGAEFSVYSQYTDDVNNTPLNIIPTRIEGVYIVDDKESDGRHITGVNKKTSRQTAKEEYFTKLAKHLEYSDTEIAAAKDAGNWNLVDERTNNKLVTPENGKVVILGVKEGTYYFVEDVAPTGYNKLKSSFSLVADKENMREFSVYANVTGTPPIDGSGASSADSSEINTNYGEVKDYNQDKYPYTKQAYNVTYTEVENSKGVELPSTGGTGTMMFVTIGSMVAIAFAVLLITHKKMTVYED